MTAQYDCGCEAKVYDLIEGNDIDLEVNKCDSEVRADIIVKKICGVRIWGQVKDCVGNPVECAMVKLLKANYCNGKINFEGIAHTITDHSGFYQFDVCIAEDHSKFKIIVSKANYGKERVIHENDTCECCHDNDICESCNNGNIKPDPCQLCEDRDIKKGGVCYPSRNVYSY